MIKAVIAGVIAFALSLGGTTLVMVRRAPAPAPVAAAKDSTTAKDSARVKPGSKASPAGKPSADHAGADSAHGPDSTAKPDVAAAMAPEAIPPSAITPVRNTKPPVDPVAKAAAVKSVARVLSAMKPPEAAKVMGLLSDDEVENILRAVGPRQAADFLTNLPKERAAALSRRLLVPRTQEASR